MTYHARKSPSGADRWATCPGSLVLAENIHDEGNEAAALGTAKHFISAECLNFDLEPDTFQGQMVWIVNGNAQLQAPRKPAQYVFEIDDAFVDDVRTYVNAVRAYAVNGRMWLEQAVPIDHMTDEQGATGSADAVILSFDGELQVHDAKFGYTPVDVVRNKQLMMYASGALRYLENNDAENEEIRRFRIVIHQPAQGPATEYAFDETELLAFEDEIRVASARVDNAIANADKWVGKSMEYLNPSEKACRWCRAKATCPALDHLIQQQMGVGFENLEEHPPEKVLPVTEPAALKTKFAVLGLIEDWIKAVRAEVESLLLRHRNSPEIVEALGAKLVQGRAGSRKWVDEKSAEAKLKAMRLKKEDMYNYSLISPTGAEELLAKENPRKWTKLQGLITRADGKPSVALLSDKRPSMVIADPGAGFEDISKEPSNDNPLV